MMNEPENRGCATTDDVDSVRAAVEKIEDSMKLPDGRLMDVGADLLELEHKVFALAEIVELMALRLGVGGGLLEEINRYRDFRGWDRQRLEDSDT